MLFPVKVAGVFGLWTVSIAVLQVDLRVNQVVVLLLLLIPNGRSLLLGGLELWINRLQGDPKKQLIPHYSPNNNHIYKQRHKD